MIRQATVADAGAIAAVQVASWHVTYPGLIPPRMLARMTGDNRFSRWRESLESRAGRDRTSVLEVEGRVAGFVTADRARDPVLRELGATGEIWSIYLTPDQQGRGLGRALFAHARGRLENGGMNRFGLWVITGNHGAEGFYRRMGGRRGPTQRAEDAGCRFSETAWLWT